MCIQCETLCLPGASSLGLSSLVTTIEEIYIYIYIYIPIRHCWTLLDSLVHLDSVGLTLTHFDLPGLNPIDLDSLGLTWIHLEPLGFIWILLYSPGFTWTHKAPTRVVCWEQQPNICMCFAGRMFSSTCCFRQSDAHGMCNGMCTH